MARLPDAVGRLVERRDPTLVICRKGFDGGRHLAIDEVEVRGARAPRGECVERAELRPVAAEALLDSLVAFCVELGTGVELAGGSACRRVESDLRDAAAGGSRYT